MVAVFVSCFLPRGKSQPSKSQASFTAALVTALQGDKHSQEDFTRPVADIKTVCNMCEKEKLNLYEFQACTREPHSS